jgi:2-keto-4-pentenoate hydratase/2-oxohepta-3-ene-1,7-dioic acid hydratase in catechol pathway
VTERRSPPSSTRGAASSASSTSRPASTATSCRSSATAAGQSWRNSLTTRATRCSSTRSVVRFGASYRHPRLIWGIGLNYVDHAADLSEQVPDEPASFVLSNPVVQG